MSPNYGRYGGPENYYQGGGDGSFDPYSGRLNVGQLIQQFILRKRAEEEQAKQAQWDVEDRDLNKRVKEAQIRNYDEVAQPKAPVQKGYQLPPSVKKDVAQYHGFKDETEYEQYDPQMQQTMFEEYLDAKQTLLKEGVGGKPTKTGAAKLKSIKDILGVIKDRATQIGAEYRGLINNPLAAQYLGQDAQSVMEDYKKRLANLNRTRYRISSFIRQMDESGGLPAALEEELRTYLDMPESLEQGTIFGSGNPARPKPKLTEAEKKLPPGFTIK